MINNISINNKPNMKWVDYIFSKKGQSTPKEFKSLSDLSPQDRERYAWADYLQRWEDNGYKIYHLVITYIEPKERFYTVDDLKRIFNKFYMRYFLKKIVGNNYTEPAKIERHPLTLCFLEEHESKAKTSCYGDRFGDRYHIHAMIAAHPDTIDKMEGLVGTNTFDKSKSYCSNIMTSFLEERDPQCVLYASKDFNKEREFMLFGGVSKPH